MKIKDILVTPNSLNVTYNTRVLIDTPTVYTYLMRKYKNWETGATDSIQFYEEYQNYVKMTAFNLSKIIDAFELEYNPIENYNGVETVTSVYGEHHTFDTMGSQLNEYNYGATSGTVKDSSTTNDISTFNDIGKVDSTTEARQDTSNVGGRMDEHQSAAHTDTVTTSKSGNMGVTSTQSMELQEYELRKINLVAEYLDRLVYDMYYYVGGED